MPSHAGLCFAAPRCRSTYFNLHNNQTDDYGRKLFITWNYRLMIQTGSLHRQPGPLSLHEKKSSPACTESHCKHLEAEFDHNNPYSAASDLAPGIPATVMFQNFSLLVSSISEMEAICCKSFHILKLQRSWEHARFWTFYCPASDSMLVKIKKTHLKWKLRYLWIICYLIKITNKMDKLSLFHSSCLYMKEAGRMMRLWSKLQDTWRLPLT